MLSEAGQNNVARTGDLSPSDILLSSVCVCFVKDFTKMRKIHFESAEKRTDYSGNEIHHFSIRRHFLRFTLSFQHRTDAFQTSKIIYIYTIISTQIHSQD